MTEAANCPPSSIMQSIFAVATAAMAGGGVITVAIGRIFDTDKVRVITGLQWEIKGLQKEIKRTEDVNSKLEKDNEELREKTNSSMNIQLIDIQEKYNKLISDHRKAIAIINKLKKENP